MWQLCTWISSLWSHEFCSLRAPFVTESNASNPRGCDRQGCLLSKGGAPISSQWSRRQISRQSEVTTTFSFAGTAYSCSHYFPADLEGAGCPSVCIRNSLTCLLCLVCLLAAVESRERWVCACCLQYCCRQLSAGSPLQTEAPADCTFHLTACMGSCWVLTWASKRSSLGDSGWALAILWSSLNNCTYLRSLPPPKCSKLSAHHSKWL